MSRNTANCPTVICAAVLCALLLIGFHAFAQTETPATATPVGHWVAEHVSTSGIGSWWDFRPDGTLTMHVGAIVTSPITRSGDTFTSPLSSNGTSPLDNQSNSGPGWSFSSATKPSTDTELYITTLPTGSPLLWGAPKLACRELSVL